ncbi:MAG TPA: hypothetical protein VMH03_07300 [Terriglobales bacterium]|nr:hypothetical protein [Terriglobales bacterium]
MAKTKTTTGKRSGAITFDEFISKHKEEPLFSTEPVPLSRFLRRTPPHYEIPTIPVRLLKGELKHWRPVRMLEAAARDNCSAAFNLALRLLLLKMDIEPPMGVLTPLAGTHGRQHERIYEALQNIQQAHPNSIQQICEWLDRGSTPLPNSKLFSAFRTWQEAFARKPSYTSKWISTARKNLYLPALRRGPK